MLGLRLLSGAAVLVTLASLSAPARAQAEDDPPGGGWFDEEEEPAAPEPGSDPADGGEEAEETPAADPDPFPGESERRRKQEEAASKKQLALARPPLRDVSPPRPPVTGRFRGGISALFAGARYGDDEDFSFLTAIEGRFGGQIDEVWAVYATPSVAISETTRLGGGPTVEVTLSDVFSIGAGAEGILGALGERGDWTAGASVGARAGLHLGVYEPGRRKVFSMDLITKVDFYFDDTRVFILGGALGYDSM